MGKGDKKTRKGKTYAGSYGNLRPQTIKTVAPKKTIVAAPKPPVKKAAAPARKKA